MADGEDTNMNSVTSRMRKPVASNVSNVATNMRRKSRQSQRRTSHNRVVLERVLGISIASSSGLTCDPTSGLIAYPAGCVIVLLHPKKNKQSHIINTSRKPFSALAFSHDGKYLVTGESGHMPCVRVWEVDGCQAAEVQSHKYGVACVAFSANSTYIVSVGYQHDMTVSVWDWRKGAVVASNKVSSRVAAVSFSEDSSYFVTAGNRHVKFWYLDASKEKRVNSTVPLIGRSGLLGDLKNSVFCGVACGRGLMASSTYCITSSGLLCLFSSSRELGLWVDLKTSSASCLAVSEAYIFCGCADGTVRVFSPPNLQYITTLHRPHCLGVDLTQGIQHGDLLTASPGAQYPDTLALTFDPVARHLTCVYNDHSVYVWDVGNVRNVGKLYSALYHSGCVWSVEVYPELLDPLQACLPPTSFLTCSSDNTIRIWHADPPTGHQNLYSNDLLKILYVGENTQHLQVEGDRGDGAGGDGKSGIRVLGISPDGQHLAAGDRCGNLRIFGLQFLDELVKIEAHDSEVLCLEFAPTGTGLKLLATASRDRLIHVFNLEKDYSLEQTLNDHSASITAIKFTGESPEVRMVSCGADKSIYFRTAEQTPEGLTFSRSHHVVEKTTLYDMDLDSSQTHTAIACQDRNIRVYNVESGKLKKCFKGSSSDDGALLKVQMDPSGTFLATSCSDKNITIFDYESGESVATLFGHSEIITCMRFSQDCRHLITVSGDSCVFVWRLDSQMTNTMRKKLVQRRPSAPPKTSTSKQHKIRRETFISVPSNQLPQMEEELDPNTPVRLDSTHDVPPDAPLLQTNGKLPMWYRKRQRLGRGSSVVQPAAEPEPRPPRSRWSEQPNSLIIFSHYTPSPTKTEEEEEAEEEDLYFHPQSLDSLLDKEEEDEEEEEEEEKVLQVPDDDQFAGLSSSDRSDYILYPTNSTTADGDFDVQALTKTQRSLLQLQGQGEGHDEGSAGSLDHPQDDTDSLSQGSSIGSSGMEEEEGDALRNHFETLADGLASEKFEMDLNTLQTPDDRHFLNPRLSISTRFLSRFQHRIRAWPSQDPPPVSLPPRISEESSLNNTAVNPKPCTENCSSDSSESSDVTAKALSTHNSLVPATQQGSTRQGYMGTTASSRAKVTQDLLTSSQEEKENLPTFSSSPEPQPPPSVGLGYLSARTTLHLDLASSLPLLPQKAQQHVSVALPCRSALVTPTEMRSLGVEERRSISSIEETLAARGRTLNPAPSITSSSTSSTATSSSSSTASITTSSISSTATSTSSAASITSSSISSTANSTASITSSTTSTASITSSSTTSTASITASLASESRQTCSPGGAERSGVEADAGNQREGDLQVGSPLSDQLCPTHPGCVDESVSVQRCHQVANELRHTVRRAVQLYQEVSILPGSPEQRLQMSSVLKEAISAVQTDLVSVLAEGRDSASCGQLTDDRTLALLEKYSDMLLQITQNKLASWPAS